MKTLVSMLFVVLTAIAPASWADDDDSLFINLTSDDPWRAGMALAFATNNVKHGHPVTVFLNVEGVRIAAKTVEHPVSTATGKTAAEMLNGFIASGGKVIVCPMCLKRAELSPQDLVDGVTMGGPKVTLPALYASDVQLSY